MATKKLTNEDVRFHTQPIIGAVCAHFQCVCDHSLPGHESDRHEGGVKLFWLGDGSTTVYVGKCMDEPATFVSRVRNPDYDYATTVAEFKSLAIRFARDES